LLRCEDAHDNDRVAIGQAFASPHRKSSPKHLPGRGRRRFHTI